MRTGGPNQDQRDDPKGEAQEGPSHDPTAAQRRGGSRSASLRAGARTACDTWRIGRNPRSGLPPRRGEDRRSESPSDRSAAEAKADLFHIAEVVGTAIVWFLMILCNGLSVYVISSTLSHSTQAPRPQ